MKRYTIIVSTKEEFIDLNNIKLLIEKKLSNLSPPTCLISIYRSDTQLYLYIKSEAERENVPILFNVFKEISDFENIDVGWGWIQKDTIDKYQNPDPFATVKPQASDIGEYRFGIGQAITIVFMSGGLMIGLIFLMLGYVNDLLNEGLGYAFLGFILCLVFSYGLSHNKVCGIRCTTNEMNVRTWYKTEKHFEWREITGLDIKFQRGRWCYIYINSDNIVFPFDKFYGLQNKNTLISTIVHRGSLLFVEGFEGGDIIYRRFDSGS